MDATGKCMNEQDYTAWSFEYCFAEAVVNECIRALGSSNHDYNSETPKTHFGIE